MPRRLLALGAFETGNILDAEEARKAGLIDELVPEGEALITAMRYAKELAKGSRAAVCWSDGAPPQRALPLAGRAASLGHSGAATH